MAIEFGNKDLISEKTKKIADEILSFASFRKDIHCYFRYPFIKADDISKSLPFLIVSKSGIFNFCETENDMKTFFEFAYPKIMLIPSLLNKFSSGIQIFKNIMINNYLGVEIFDDESILTDNEISEFESLFQNAKSLNGIDSRDVSSNKTIGFLIKERSKQINTFSSRQFSYVNEDDHSIFYRIRGLAGSGKTIVMIKRMAYMHYKHPELKMAFVFYTVSLKQTVTNLFIKFYKDYSSSESYNKEKIFFLHGWGSSSMPGFYSTICNKQNVQPEPYEFDSYTRNSFGGVCGRLLDKIEGRLSLFDYVFIDEAQDFSIEFFKLVLKSLTPSGAFSYAYDELQTLTSSVGIPSRKEIFGNKMPIDINLTTCYRTPKQILVTAHALGMGIYRDDADNSLPVNIPQDVQVWKAIGYNSKPSIVKLGEQVKFFRDEPFSQTFVPKEPVTISEFKNKQEQYIDLFNEIKMLIKNEDVLPEDILIIDLETNNYENNYQDFRTICFSRMRMGNHDLEDPPFSIHLIGTNDRYYFKRKGSVTFTSVFRAKGNESNIVFVINSNNMTSLQSFMRNRLFTAMTRSKFKTYVYGCDGMNKFYNECQRVIDNDYCLIFKYPSKQELENIQKIAKEEEDSAGIISNVSDNAVKLKAKDANAYYEMLVSMHGKEIADKIIELEKNDKK